MGRGWGGFGESPLGFVYLHESSYTCVFFFYFSSPFSFPLFLSILLIIIVTGLFWVCFCVLILSNIAKHGMELQIHVKRQTTLN